MTYSELDLKSMLNRAGVVGKVPCETLINLHFALRDEFVSNKPTVLDLLQTASLVQEHLCIGMSLQQAIRDSAMDVYVRPKRNTTLKQVRKSSRVPFVDNSVFRNTTLFSIQL